MHTSTGGVFYTLAYIYEEEDTCHMRRRIHAYEHGSFVSYTHVYIYMEEDTCHMRRRMHACTPLSYHIQSLGGCRRGSR